jgi:hypothetical protein
MLRHFGGAGRTQALLVIAVINSHSHPLADSGGLVSELDFYVVAGFVDRLVLALVPCGSQRPGVSLPSIHVELLGNTPREDSRRKHTR